jgi:hypothetical protein
MQLEPDRVYFNATHKSWLYLNLILQLPWKSAVYLTYRKPSVWYISQLLLYCIYRFSRLWGVAGGACQLQGRAMNPVLSQIKLEGKSSVLLGSGTASLGNCSPTFRHKPSGLIFRGLVLDISTFDDKTSRLFRKFGDKLLIGAAP